MIGSVWLMSIYVIVIVVIMLQIIGELMMIIVEIGFQLMIIGLRVMKEIIVVMRVFDLFRISICGVLRQGVKLEMVIVRLNGVYYSLIDKLVFEQLMVEIIKLVLVMVIVIVLLSQLS